MHMYIEKKMYAVVMSDTSLGVGLGEHLNKTNHVYTFSKTKMRQYTFLYLQ